MPSQSAIESIAQIHVPVEDIERAVAFYRDTLGLKFLFDVPGQSMAFFDCAGVRLYLGKTEGGAVRSRPLIYYRVADVEQAHAALSAAAVEFVSGPHVVHRTATHEMWLTAFRDSEGNIVQLTCDKTVD